MKADTLPVRKTHANITTILSRHAQTNHNHILMNRTTIAYIIIIVNNTEDFRINQIMGTLSAVKRIYCLREKCEINARPAMMKCPALLVRVITVSLS